MLLYLDTTLVVAWTGFGLKPVRQEPQYMYRLSCIQIYIYTHIDTSLAEGWIHTFEKDYVYTCKVVMPLCVTRASLPLESSREHFHRAASPSIA